MVMMVLLIVVMMMVLATMIPLQPPRPRDARRITE
jgi:hypothetical protein